MIESQVLPSRSSKTILPSFPFVSGFVKDHCITTQAKSNFFDPLLLPHLVKAFCLKFHPKPLTLSRFTRVSLWSHNRVTLTSQESFIGPYSPRILRSRAHYIKKYSPSLGLGFPLALLGEPFILLLEQVNPNTTVSPLNRLLKSLCPNH